MYVRRRIRFVHVLVGTWLQMLLTLCWIAAVIALYTVWDVHDLIVPVLPVTLVGIAVSLYLSFRGTTAYSRWWEARREFGTIAAVGRTWVNQIDSFLFRGSERVPAEVRRDLIERHIGIVYAAAYQLRRTSRLRVGSRWSLFANRRPVTDSALLLSEPAAYRGFLANEEYIASRAFSSPATYLLWRQGDRLRELAQEGWLDSVRQASMMKVLGTIETSLGRCERLKNTPFPRQIAYFGAVFTWIFVFLLPLALLEVFEHEATEHALSTVLTHRYMYTMLPFSLVISWVFLTMEQVSDSMEDPFEGGVHDVPVTTLTRSCEVEMRQALGEAALSPPVAPVDNALY